MSADPEQIKQPPQPGMRACGMQYKQPVYLFRSEARFAGPLVEFDPRHALTPQIASRHDAARRTIVPKPQPGWRQQYLASFRGMCELLHTSPRGTGISSRSSISRDHQVALDPMGYSGLKGADEDEPCADPPSKEGGGPGN